MTLPSSGAISMSAISNELQLPTNTSFRTLSATASKSAPDSFSEFYGYTYRSLSVNDYLFRFDANTMYYCGYSGGYYGTLFVTATAGQSWFIDLSGNYNDFFISATTGTGNATIQISLLTSGYDLNAEMKFYWNDWVNTGVIVYLASSTAGC